MRTSALKAPAIYPASAPPMPSAQMQDVGGLGSDPDTQAILDAIYPQSQPVMQQAPGANIGPLHLSGSGLDAASMAILQQMQNAPQPRNFGQGLLSGFAGGWAGARGSQAVARQNANAEALKQTHQDTIDRRKLAAQMMAEGRKDMTINDQGMADLLGKPIGTKVPASVFTAALGIANRPDKAPSTDPMVDINNPAMQAFFGRMHYSPAPGITQMRQSELTALGKPTAVDKQEPMGAAQQEFAGQQLAAGADLPFGIWRGMSPEDKAGVMKAWARLSGSGYKAAEAKAVYAGTKGSIGALTKVANNARAWSSLVDKNIGVIEPILQKIKDTGTEWGNAPARSLVKGLGDVPVAQFNFALETLKPEVSRLLNSPGLTGVLTVDAKRDMNAVLNNSYTVPQLEGVFKIIKLDKQNRLDTYDEALKAAAGSIGEQDGIPVSAPTGTLPPKTLAEQALDFVTGKRGKKP